MRRPRLPRAVRATAPAVAFLVVLASGMFPSHASGLASAEARLKSLIKRVKAARLQEENLQRQLNALAARISQVQTEMAQTQARIHHTQTAIAAAQASIEQHQSTINQRAVVAYEAGPASTVEFLLGSTSMADLNDRIQFTDAAAQADQDLINELHTQQNVLREKESQLKQLESSLKRQQADLQSQQTALNAKFAKAKEVYGKFSRARRQAEAIVRTQKRLAAQGALLGTGLPSAGGPAISGVLLACPVHGPHAYVDDFGAPRPGHIHAGVDIQAATGTPIVAPFPGRAVRTWDAGGGNGVFVYGSLGYAYNAHLSSYGSLGRVSTGTVIGYVGSTGDATGPHDHFEWNPNVIPAHPYVSPYGYSVVGSAIDAFPYLNSVC